MGNDRAACGAFHAGDTTKVKTLFATCIAALGLQAASMETLKVSLPGPVMAGGVELPLGECTIQEMSNGSDNVVLLVRSKTGEHVNILVNRISNTRDSGSGVVLSKQNNRYSLDQVWLNGEEGFQVLRVSGE
jgi:hypothetical protein